jgi:hypothetical protein
MCYVSDFRFVVGRRLPIVYIDTPLSDEAAFNNSLSCIHQELKLLGWASFADLSMGLGIEG